MTPVASNKVGVANALPIRLVMLATALALALIASMGWYVWNSVQVLREVQVRTFRLLSLAGEIAYLNESVWISARLRISTGEPRWMDQHAGFDAQLFGRAGERCADGFVIEWIEGGQGVAQFLQARFVLGGQLSFSGFGIIFYFLLEIETSVSGQLAE